MRIPILLALLATLSIGVANAGDSKPMRIWLDEYIFRPSELNLMQHVINASDDMLVMAGKTMSRLLEPKGHKMLHKHDFLWTGRTACYAAFRDKGLTPTNTLSCTPGTEAITGKSAFVSTLNNAYGLTAASTVMPTAFILPQQYKEFANHIYDTHAAGNWALKEDVHRGKGVVAAPGRCVLHQALEKIELKKKGLKAHRFVMAQRFIDDQLLINNRPFVLRLWASFAGGIPVLRGHLFSGGIAIFGSEHQPKNNNNKKKIDENKPASEKSIESAAAQEEQLGRIQSLVVNIYQQNRSAAINPWSVSDIKAHLHKQTGSDTAFDSMWNVVERSTAAALAAAVPSVRKTIASSRLKRYQGGNTELLGLDFVVDSSLRPWLVEVNYLPSMARKVVDCVPPSAVAVTAEKLEERMTRTTEKGKTEKEVCRENPMDLEKEAFLRSYLRVFAARHTGLEDHIIAAQAAVKTQHNDKKETETAGSSKCTTITAEFLRQILDAENEWQAARDNGFSDLTGYIYESLECIAGNAAACAAALPPAPPAIQKETDDLTFSHKLQVNIEWGMAQVRRVGLAIDYVLKLLGGPRRRAAPPPPRYVALPQDALVKAWLQLPVKERRSGSAERVLENLCALELSINAENAKLKGNDNDNASAAAAAATAAAVKDEL